MLKLSLILDFPHELFEMKFKLLLQEKIFIIYPLLNPKIIRRSTERFLIKP